MIFHVLRPCTMFLQSAYRLHICWYATCFKPIINNWQLILISCSTFKKKAPNGHHGRQDRCEAQQARLEQWYPECAEARPHQDRTQEEWWGRRQGRALLSGHRCWDPPGRAEGPEYQACGGRRLDLPGFWSLSNQIFGVFGSLLALSSIGLWENLGSLFDVIVVLGWFWTLQDSWTCVLWSVDTNLFCSRSHQPCNMSESCFIPIWTPWVRILCCQAPEVLLVFVVGANCHSKAILQHTTAPSPAPVLA